MRASTITTASLALFALLGLGLPSRAEEPAAENTAEPAATEDAAPEGPAFKYQTGNILLPNKVATLHLAGNYRYLDPAETEKLLVAWGNQPGNDTQGAIVPTEVDPMATEGWAVILTYENDGHVDDSDAKDIDYDDMLKDMKQGTEDDNEARKEAGFGAVHLLGWAEKPHYDTDAKKLYWAKELKFEGAQANTLNYDVRVLGREGVLSMNAVASIGQLTQIRSDMKPLIQVAEFNEGYRYAEFNSKTDRMAEYGLGALIAGGVAAKLGLFGKLFALLVAFKKVILVGLVAIGSFVAKMFGKKKDAAA
jgi:uncharacterized membrane-anchored protein